MNKQDMAHELRVHIIRNYGSQAAAAAKWGVSEATVSKVINCKVDPTAQMLADAGFECVQPAPFYRKVKKEKQK